jgi:TonB family protein
MRRYQLLAVMISLLLHALLFLWGTNVSTSEGIAFREGKGAIEVSGVSGGLVSTGEPGIGPRVSSSSGLSPSPSGSLPEAGIVEGSALGIPAPEYPKLSRLRKEEGEVLIQLWFDDAQKLVEAEVIKSSGYLLLDSAALTAVKRGLPPASNLNRKHEKKIRFHFELKK